MAAKKKGTSGPMAAAIARSRLGGLAMAAGKGKNALGKNKRRVRAAIGGGGGG